MKKLDLTNVQEAGEFKQVKAGGYVLTITAAEDVAQKEYLKIELDIAEGENAFHFTDLYADKGFWGLSDVRSYKEKALPFFKGFITAVERSNDKYIFNSDEETLRGKLVGAVLREEEYIKGNGTVGVRLKVDKYCSAERIREGEFTIPEKVCVAKPADPFAGLNSTDEDAPF